MGLPVRGEENRAVWRSPSRLEFEKSHLEMLSSDSGSRIYQNPQQQEQPPLTEPRHCITSERPEPDNTHRPCPPHTRRTPFLHHVFTNTRRHTLRIKKTAVAEFPPKVIFFFLPQTRLGVRPCLGNKHNIRAELRANNSPLRLFSEKL